MATPTLKLVLGDEHSAALDADKGSPFLQDEDRTLHCCDADRVELGESRDRRRQAAHPAKVKPELVAHKPGEIYSWDITKLRGPLRGV